MNRRQSKKNLDFGIIFIWKIWKRQGWSAVRCQVCNTWFYPSLIGPNWSRYDWQCVTMLAVVGMSPQWGRLSSSCPQSPHLISGDNCPFYPPGTGQLTLIACTPAPSQHSSCRCDDCAAAGVVCHWRWDGNSRAAPPILEWSLHKGCWRLLVLSSVGWCHHLVTAFLVSSSVHTVLSTELLS